MNTLVHFINKTFKRLRIFSHLDLSATFALRKKSKLEGWASVYVYPKNNVKISKNSTIHVVNGLLTFSMPWFEAKNTNHCEFEMKGKARLECDGNFDFIRGSRCGIKDGGVLRLGKDGRIGNGAAIECNNEIVIGSNCWISDHVTIADAGKIVIEDGVWIGNSVRIKGNLRIGKNAVVGEGMEVVSDVPENLILTKDFQKRQV